MGGCCSSNDSVDGKANNRTGGYRPPKNNWGGGKALGGSSGNAVGKSPEQIRAAALDAAEQRRQKNTKGVDSESA